MQAITFLDLFAGCGGLSEGFISVGYEAIAHVEMDVAACNTLRTRQAYHWLKANSLTDLYREYQTRAISRNELYSAVPNSVTDSVINEEISNTNSARLFDLIDSKLRGRKLNIIVGGPPCQAYSLAGRARDKNKMKNDPRNHLFNLYAGFLRRFRPEMFVSENVPGLLTAKDSRGNSYLESMLKLFRETGYVTDYQVLTASDYGVPQERRRVILIGSIRKTGFSFAKIPNNCWDGIVKHILHDLPPLLSGEGSWCERSVFPPRTHHIARNSSEVDKEIYRLIVESWDTNRYRLK